VFSRYNFGENPKTKKFLLNKLGNSAYNFVGIKVYEVNQVCLGFMTEVAVEPVLDDALKGIVMLK